MCERKRIVDDKVKKITAYKELLEKARDHSYALYAYYHKGAKYRQVDWQFPLLYKISDDTLKEVLERLTWADFPATLETAEKEAEVVRLVLEAGGNPNQMNYDDSVFVCFMDKNRVGAALEIAKRPNFQFPRGEENKILGALASNVGTNKHNHPCYLSTQLELENLPSWNKKRKEQLEKKLQEDLRYHKAWQHQSKDLIYTLFQQGVYPQNYTKLFQCLAPIVLEKDPEFFTKKKEQIISQMHHAKTPTQIYDALMNRKKEKVNG